MFKKVLIANRGEIAVRIIRACRDLGIISVAVYSTADADSLHTQIADETVCIGPPKAKDSYLNINAIVSAAVSSGADAIHPGFGFLSENSEFARKCEEHNIVFIGPSYQSMEKMGDKIEARKTAHSQNVPITPGSVGEVKSIDEAVKIAGEIGYPLMIKAASGGGGRGIRKVDKAEDLKSMYDNAKSEAAACFGDDRVYIERCIAQPRHVEIQILADNFGNVIHLYDRDCTVQRRHQKLLEESPSTYINDETREKMGECAVRIAKAAGYKNVGTVEFLVDKDRNFYFCEMNTRIQVEHPVTETVCRVDLVAQQLLIAQNQPLSLKQSDIKQHGFAMECRINAEDPSKNFAPSPGEIQGLNIPGGIGVRVDSGVYQGYTITPYYDSMIAKIIVCGDSRTQCISRMKRALSELLFVGVTTNTDYQLAILDNKTFINGDYSTDFLDNEKLI